MTVPTVIVEDAAHAGVGQRVSLSMPSRQVHQPSVHEHHAHLGVLRAVDLDVQDGSIRGDDLSGRATVAGRDVGSRRTAGLAVVRLQQPPPSGKC